VSDPRFDLEWELDILATAARDPGFRFRAIRACDAHAFSDDRLGWIWQVLRDLSPNEGAPARVFKERARREFADKEARAEVLKVVLRVLRRTPETSTTALDELHTFQRRHLLIRTFDRGVEDLNAGQVDRAWRRATTLAGRDPAAPAVALDWYGTVEARLAAAEERRRHPERFIVVPTGFPFLDRVMKGLEAKELGLIMGTTGRGKSIFATCLVWKAAIAGFPVLFVQGEMAGDRVGYRLDSKFTGLEEIAIRRFRISSAEVKFVRDKLRRMERRLRNMITILELPIRGGSFADVDRAFEERQAAGLPQFKLVVGDSLDHFNPVDEAESFRLSQSQVYWEGKRFAFDRNVALWSTVHAGKGVAKKIAHAEDAGESYDKSRIADAVVTLNQTTRQRREGIVTALLDKYRGGVSDVARRLDTDYSRMIMVEAEDDEDEDDDRDSEDDG